MSLVQTEEGAQKSQQTCLAFRIFLKSILALPFWNLEVAQDDA
jgi:hypothetical protein